MKKYIYTLKDGRMIAIIVDGNHRTTKSYPRLLMEEKLGRPLDKNEDVHHKDGNRYNNSLDNLEVIPHEEHQKLHSHKKYHDKIVNCVVCGKEFTLTAKQQQRIHNDRNRSKPRFRGITCSRTCAYYLNKVI